MGFNDQLSFSRITHMQPAQLAKQRPGKIRPGVCCCINVQNLLKVRLCDRPTLFCVCHIDYLGYPVATAAVSIKTSSWTQNGVELLCDKAFQPDTNGFIFKNNKWFIN